MVALGWPEAVAAQCAMCKTALTNSPEGRDIGEQFNRAILLMIGAPYVVFGAVGAAIFRERLRARWRRFRWPRAASPISPRPRP
jgi:hypothetical protein